MTRTPQQCRPSSTSLHICQHQHLPPEQGTPRVETERPDCLSVCLSLCVRMYVCVCMYVRMYVLPTRVLDGRTDGRTDTDLNIRSLGVKTDDSLHGYCSLFYMGRPRPPPPTTYHSRSVSSSPLLLLNTVYSPAMALGEFLGRCLVKLDQTSIYQSPPQGFTRPVLLFSFTST